MPGIPVDNREMKAASCWHRKWPGSGRRGKGKATDERLPLATKRAQKVRNIDETCHVPYMCVCVCVSACDCVCPCEVSCALFPLDRTAWHWFSHSHCCPPPPPKADSLSNLRPFPERGQFRNCLLIYGLKSGTQVIAIAIIFHVYKAVVS